VTKKDFAGNSVKDLVELAKAQPGKFNFMSVGAASPTRLQAEILIQSTGIKAVAVPYKGAAPALMAMLGGEVTFGFLSYPAVKSQLAAGSIKVLAVTGETRMPELPNVPTMAESGYPGSQSYSWEGLFVPAKTPAKIVAKLNTAFNQTLADPEVKRKLRENGIETVGGTTASFNTFVKSEFDKWTNFVRVTKITFDD
jgi:tripartite-type tricarboxylate transporter receptor subunit TctC